MTFSTTSTSTFDAAEASERRACGCYFDAPCDCYSSYDESGEDHYDDYDRYGSDYDEDACEGVHDSCPFGGCRDCDGDVDDDSGFLPEDAAMESGLFGDC